MKAIWGRSGLSWTTGAIAALMQGSRQLVRPLGHLLDGLVDDVQVDALLGHLAVRLGHQLYERVQRDLQPGDVLQQSTALASSPHRCCLALTPAEIARPGYAWPACVQGC